MHIKRNSFEWVEGVALWSVTTTRQTCLCVCYMYDNTCKIPANTHSLRAFRLLCAVSRTTLFSAGNIRKHIVLTCNQLLG